MHRLFATILLAATLCLAGLVGPRSAVADTFKMDAAHTHVGFKVRHMGVSWVKGQFAEVSGTVEWSPESPDDISLDITIDVKSIDTRNKTRDTHLRSPDFFAAAKHPKMTYVSKSSVKTETGYDVTGDLTIRGVAKEVVLHVEGPTDEVKDPFVGKKRGASATAEVNRKDFGLKWNKVTEMGSIVVGDVVRIEIETELLVR
jgi:polyisoprenoid-binding protein YceI